MAELRIGELVDTPIRTNTKVAPDGRRRLEGDALDLARRGLEAFIGVLGRDARREDVLLDGPALCLCGYWRARGAVCSPRWRGGRSVQWSSYAIHLRVDGVPRLSRDAYVDGVEAVSYTHLTLPTILLV